jgi:hypothetical protein
MGMVVEAEIFRLELEFVETNVGVLGGALGALMLEGPFGELSPDCVAELDDDIEAEVLAPSDGNPVGLGGVESVSAAARMKERHRRANTRSKDCMGRIASVYKRQCNSNTSQVI